jgi:hypothetical protein
MFSQQRGHISLGELLTVFHGVEHGPFDAGHEVGVLATPAANASPDSSTLPLLLRRHRPIGVGAVGVLRRLVTVTLRVVEDSSVAASTTT